MGVLNIAEMDDKNACPTVDSNSGRGGGLAGVSGASDICCAAAEQIYAQQIKSMGSRGGRRGMGGGIRLEDLLQESGMHLEDLLLPANEEEDAPRGPRQERPSKRKRRAEQKHVLSEWHTVLFTLYLVVLHHKGMNHTEMTPHDDLYDLTPSFPARGPGAPPM